MPVDKKRKRVKAANTARSKTKSNTGPRAYLPAHDPAPKAIDASPAESKRQTKEVVRLEKFERLKVSKKRKRTSSLTNETSRKRPRADIQILRAAEPAVLQLEGKWHAVSLFTEARGIGNGHVSNEATNEIGRRFGVTGETVRVWATKAEQGQSLVRNDGSGYYLSQYH
jgi:hypothetical protein